MTDRLADTLDALIETAARPAGASFTLLVAAAKLDPARDFLGADLRNIDFRDEDLRGFNFTRADLMGADFRRANVSGVSFEGAALTGAIGLPESIDDNYIRQYVSLFRLVNTACATVFGAMTFESKSTNPVMIELHESAAGHFLLLLTSIIRSVEDKLVAIEIRVTDHYAYVELKLLKGILGTVKELWQQVRRFPKIEARIASELRALGAESWVVEDRSRDSYIAIGMPLKIGSPLPRRPDGRTQVLVGFLGAFGVKSDK